MKLEFLQSEVLKLKSENEHLKSKLDDADVEIENCQETINKLKNIKKSSSRLSIFLGNKPQVFLTCLSQSRPLASL